MSKKKPNDPSTLALSTRAVHGKRLGAFQGPVTFPVYQTSNYRFASSDDAIRYAEGDPSVYVYTRYHNPTVHEVEETLAVMQGADEGMLFASGMAAISTAILAVTKPGDDIISTPALYGGTYRWFRDELPKLGITVQWVDPDKLSGVPRLVTPRTRLVYFETPTNPTLSIVDIAELVASAKAAAKKLKRPLPTMIDNTFATVLNQNPFRMGVDVVVESATKYLGGHSDIVAGSVLGPAAYMKQVRQLAKHHGGCIDPFAAYLLSRSLKTFELRVERQNVSALALAERLERHPKVARVLYPGLPSHPQHRLARKQMSAFGGMVTIDVRPSKKLGTARTAAKVCDNLRVAVNAMSLGGVETLVSVPVYSSHVKMDDAELARHGVSPGMIRISVGVEAVDDLIADFEQALDAV